MKFLNTLLRLIIKKHATVKICKNCKWGYNIVSDIKKMICDNIKMTGKKLPGELVDEISIVNFRSWNNSDDIKLYVCNNFGCIHWEENER